MKIIQKIMGLILIMGSGFFCVSATTVAEAKLRKVYRNFGFSDNEASQFCGRLNKFFKDHFDWKSIKEVGMSHEPIRDMVKLGLLIRLSDSGEEAVEQIAAQIAACVNLALRSYQKASVLRCETKKNIYVWLANRLSKYEPFSFSHAYVMEHDVSHPPAIKNYVPMDSNDFEANVVTMAAAEEMLVLQGSLPLKALRQR